MPFFKVICDEPIYERSCLFVEADSPEHARNGLFRIVEHLWSEPGKKVARMDTDVEVVERIYLADKEATADRLKDCPECKNKVTKLNPRTGKCLNCSPGWFRNYYECRACDATWSDDWDCACNDRCPMCDTEIEPVNSKNLLEATDANTA